MKKWMRYVLAAGLGVAATCGAQTFTAAASAAPGSGPFATAAKVDMEDARGKLQLKREEQIALMFLSAIENIERNCELNGQRACPMGEVLKGSKVSGEHLKFNPGVDPNYTYTLSAGWTAWEAHATPKKPGLTGFCFMSRTIGTTVTTYNPSGAAGWTDRELTNRSIEGDGFDTM